jgi:fructose-1,6-bisphosphatase/sedoheptulose 1,7-bisphosphatase-like protein
MPEQNLKDKFPLMIYMDADIAKRLAAAAEAQKRDPAELVVNILDRNLPRLQSGSVKGKIPYT